MPIVPGNEQQPDKKSSGSLFGWIVFLLVFGRPIYNLIRSVTNGIVTDQQLMIIGGGLIALIALGVIVQRVNRSRQDSTPTLPTYAPPTNPSVTLRQYRSSGDPSLPSAPRFEPIITGKVMLAGIVLALLLGVGCVLVIAVATL